MEKKQQRSELQKQKQETEKLKKEFNRFGRRQKLSSRHLVEKWRDQAKTWMETAIKLQQQQKSPTSFEAVKEATKAYAEATKELTMIPRLPDDAYSNFEMYFKTVYPVVFNYFKANYPDILNSFSEEIKKIKSVRDLYFQSKEWNEKSQVASLWKKISDASFKTWKEIMVDENGDVNKEYLEYLDRLIVPFLEEPENIVEDLRKANKAVEIEEVQNIKRVKAQTEALREKYRSQPRTAGNSISETAERWKEKATQLVSAIQTRLEKLPPDASKEPLTTELQAASTTLREATSAVQRSKQLAATTIERVFRGFRTRQKLKTDKRDKQVPRGGTIEDTEKDTEKDTDKDTVQGTDNDGYDTYKKDWEKNKAAYLQLKKFYPEPTLLSDQQYLKTRRIIADMVSSGSIFKSYMTSNKKGKVDSATLSGQTKQIQKFIIDGKAYGQKMIDLEEEKIAEEKKRRKDIFQRTTLVRWYTIITVLLIL